MAHDSYSALSDPTRRRILTALGHGARPVGELVRELEVSQPTVSKHLKVLRDVGLVTTRAEGQRRYYSIEAETLAGVARWIEELIGYLPAPAPEPAVGTAATSPGAPEPADAEADGYPTVPHEPEPSRERDPEPALPHEPEPEPTRKLEPAPQPAEPYASDPEPAQELELAPGPTAPETAGQPHLPGPAPRTLPWFTVPETARAEVEERAEAVESAGEVVEGAGEGAGPEARAAGELAAQQPRNGSEPVAEAAHGDSRGAEPEETSGEETAVLQVGNRDTGSTVETDIDVDSAESSEDSHGSVESPLTKPESGFPPVRSGAAHRRQGGLLSTLAGFRRRGRGPRR